jgi:hypothetical protein
MSLMVLILSLFQATFTVQSAPEDSSGKALVGEVQAALAVNTSIHHFTGSLKQVWVCEADVVILNS